MKAVGLRDHCSHWTLAYSAQRQAPVCRTRIGIGWNSRQPMDKVALHRSRASICCTDNRSFRHPTTVMSTVGTAWPSLRQRPARTPATASAERPEICGTDSCLSTLLIIRVSLFESHKSNQLPVLHRHASNVLARFRCSFANCLSGGTAGRFSDLTNTGVTDHLAGAFTFRISLCSTRTSTVMPTPFTAA